MTVTTTTTAKVCIASSDVSKPNPPYNDFYWSKEEEPHALRRMEILKKHPEIKQLYGHDPNFRYIVLGVWCLQVTIAAFASRLNGWEFLLVAYVVGGTANHNLMLAMHELSHNLGFKAPLANRIFSIFANLPIGVPSAISFKRYHLEHHRYQGQDEIDVDIPTVMEGTYIQNSLTKLLFVISQIGFYAIRPLIVNPKKPGTWEFINVTVCLLFDLMVYLVLGPWALAYLLSSSLLGTGLHPVAGHFISEHYVFPSVGGTTTETFSYYGPLNFFCYNVGYHNEHHDFPFVAGRNLPKVREIAKEFYDPLPQHTSWVAVLVNYILDERVTAFSRVKRRTLTATDMEKLKSE